MINIVAGQIDRSYDETAGIINTIVELLSTELKSNNAVDLEDFGVLKTDIQPEYILVDSETKERYLMPPSVEVFVESNSQDSGSEVFHTGFDVDDALYREINSAFSQFEPTLLGEGVNFPDIPQFVDEEDNEDPVLEEIVASNDDRVEEEESIRQVVVAATETELPELVATVTELQQQDPLQEQEPLEQQEPLELRESLELPETLEQEEFLEPKEPLLREAPLLQQESKIDESPHHFRRESRSRQRRSPVWIPIAGGVAIVVASLFFFKRTSAK